MVLPLSFLIMVWSISFVMASGISEEITCAVWSTVPSKTSPFIGLTDVIAWIDQESALPMAYGGCKSSMPSSSCLRSLWRYENRQVDEWNQIIVKNSIIVSEAAYTGAQGGLYLFGGKRPSLDGGVFDAFSNTLNYLHTHRWSRISVDPSSLPRPVAGASLAAHENALYLFGGYSDRGVSNQLSWLSRERDAAQVWKIIAPSQRTPKPRQGHSAVVLNGHMIIFGGTDGTTAFNDVHSLSLSTLEWNEISPNGEVPPPISFHTAISHDESMIIVGGQKWLMGLEFGGVFHFDIKTNTWLPIKEIGGKVLATTAGTRFVKMDEDTILSLGGASNDGSSNEVTINLNAPCTFSCKNGARYLNNRCICPLNWKGKYCEQPYSGCPQNCSGNGVCNGTCICNEGWTGEACDLKRCINDCNLRGECRNGVCLCDLFYSGEWCDVECSGNGGLTVSDENVYHCECNEGYSGSKCDKKICPNQCSGNGECLSNQECKCGEGFAGTDCSLPSDCSGHGRVEGYTCRCEPGWTSRDCSERLSCPNNCSSNGFCILDESKTGRCNCSVGFTGADCSIQECVHKCSGNGLCNVGKCTCYNGFFEQDCSKIVMCPRNCSANGDCLESGECKCKDGWIGKACDNQVCSRNCSNRGTCTYGTCHCEEGYSGSSCEYDCPNNCSMNGECHNHNCYCHPDFEGNDCSTMKLCLSGPRGECNGGTCFRSHKKCICPPGYAGDSCENPEHCSDCANGICFAGKCICPPGKGGANCNLDEICTDVNCGTHGLCFGGKCLCHPGWGGDGCQIEKSCPNNCSQKGICLMGQCICADMHEGQDCSIRSASNCLDPGCSDHGVCDFSQCFCAEGWHGQICASTEAAARVSNGTHVVDSITPVFSFRQQSVDSANAEESFGIAGAILAVISFTFGLVVMFAANIYSEGILVRVHKWKRSRIHSLPDTEELMAASFY